MSSHLQFAKLFLMKKNSLNMVSVYVEYTTIKTSSSPAKYALHIDSFQTENFGDLRFSDFRLQSNNSISRLSSLHNSLHVVPNCLPEYMVITTRTNLEKLVFARSGIG